MAIAFAVDPSALNGLYWAHTLSRDTRVAALGRSAMLLQLKIAIPPLAARDRGADNMIMEAARVAR